MDNSQPISEVHCFVLPCYREGAPRTFIEATKIARLRMATDVPGCRSVVEHGATGLLSDARSLESLANAIRRFLDLSPERQRNMVQTGLTKMEQEYDQQLVVDAYAYAIQELTGQRI